MSPAGTEAEIGMGLRGINRVPPGPYFRGLPLFFLNIGVAVAAAAPTDAADPGGTTTAAVAGGTAAAVTAGATPVAAVAAEAVGAGTEPAASADAAAETAVDTDAVTPPPWRGLSGLVKTDG